MTVLSDHELLDLAERYGTPLYAFGARELRRRLSYLRRTLPRAGLCYAMKANPFILPALIDQVDRLEVCSPGEYRICQALGMPNDKIVVSGVCKDRVTVDLALSQPVLPAALTIESWAQLELIQQVARERNVRVPLLLRLTSGNQFGLDRPVLMRAADTLLRDEHHANLLGIQLFSGTQKTSERRLARELGKLMELVTELEQRFAWTPAELEYGPGLPVAYFAGDTFDEEPFLHAFAQALDALPFAGSIMLELGRSIAASCGTYLTRIVDTKVNAGQPYALVDGGIHHLTYYGQSMAMKQPPCRLVTAADSAAAASAGTASTPQPSAASPSPECDTAAAPNHPGPWALCGSLCTINDLLAKQLDLGALAPGDLLAFSKAGAYCMTEGISLFLSRDLPAVVLIDADGRPHLARAPTPTDPLNTPVL